jgi:hypothetical protein
MKREKKREKCRKRDVNKEIKIKRRRKREM